jgi:hypothetical protein
MPTSSKVIETYIRAKDENRPHLMEWVFAASATLQVVVETAAISFPPWTTGRGPIEDVLVRQFGQKFENVYTFCLADPPESDDRTFSCDWLVGMSEKESGNVRVGFGRYDWRFSDHSRLVEKLTITIEQMAILDPDSLGSVMDWLAELPYPWCPAHVAAQGAPSIEDLVAIVGRVERGDFH